jgi:hypothetical protein
MAFTESKQALIRKQLKPWPVKKAAICYNGAKRFITIAAFPPMIV